MAKANSHRPARRVDPGRLLARFLCLVFAILGALPLGAGFIARSDVAQRWVSQETSRVLEQLLGLQASYAVEINLLPLEVALIDVQVESTDGGIPAFRAAKIGITPRVFSLIAGRLDIGDIAIDRPLCRLRFDNGKLQNLDLHLPDTSGDTQMEHAPFRSLSATDARFDVEIDGIHVDTGTIDLDVFVEDQRALEVALSVGESRIGYPAGLFQSTRTDGLPGPEWFWDEDVICQVDARVRVDRDGILIRRLSAAANTDIEADPGTVPACPLTTDEEPAPNRLELRSSQLRIVTNAEGGLGMVEGAIDTRVPVNLLNRLTGGAPTFDGWAALTGDFRFDPSMRLPEFDGTLRTGQFLLAGSRLVYRSEGEVRLHDDKLVVPHLNAIYGGGPVVIHDVTIAPFEPGVTLHARKVEGTDVPFPELMRDVSITPNTIVQWHIERALVQNFKGTLLPAKLDGDVHITTTHFEIFDRAFHDPARMHMLGAKPRAVIRGSFGVREDSIQFNHMDVRFGQSSMRTTVHIGFSDWVQIDVPEAKLDLTELSPLTTIPIAGMAVMSANVSGKMSDPTVEADVRIDDLVFGGFPLGNIHSPHTTFKPLHVELDDAVLSKGSSTFRIPHGRIAFDEGPAVKTALGVTTQGARTRDLLAMWNFDEDPRWKTLKGALDANARVTHVIGGPGDPCGGGDLRIAGHAKARDLTLFDEVYDRGEAEFDFHWQDVPAGYHGMMLNIPNLHLRKGSGSVIGSVRISPDAKIRGNLIANALPLSRLEPTKRWADVASGTVSAVARLSGTLDEMEAEVRANMSPIQLGRSRLPSSKLDIHLKPTPSRAQFQPKPSTCGHKVPAPLDPGSFEEDRAVGVFHVSGQMFGQQVMFDKFSVTRQAHAIAKGGLVFNELNLGPLVELRPEVGLTKQRPSGKFSGRIDFARMPTENPSASQAVAEVGTLWVAWKGFKVETEPIEDLTLSSGRLETPKVTLRVSTPKGRQAIFDVSGGVEKVATAPTFDLDLVLRPVDLASWAMLLPDLSQVAGTVQGQLQLKGPVSSPEPSGGLTLSGGHFVMREQGLTFNDVEFGVRLDRGSFELERASAAVGGGLIKARGRAPIRGAKLGEFRGEIEARSISLPVTDGVELAVDADLTATWQPVFETGERSLPKVTGKVALRSFEYSRPVTMNADIASLTRRGKRTEFESYDPRRDSVELDVVVTSDRALRLNNNLLDANLRIERPGLQLTGTNQRFGLRGRMRVEPGGRIRLRRNEFEVEAGEVRFDDPTTISPRVDLRANTEYRRYSTATSNTSAPSAGAGNSAESASAGGQWRIYMHAHGDADNLKIDLTSQPKLSQDDIFLLLTVGLTRAELDQAQSASLGESVALEALGSLTGADSAVTDAIPVIDEFRFGSSYSSRTGRTEPTVTVGKRLTERIRAYVTSGISESREVRSNLEWRLNQQVSVEGSYDNVNDISSSSLGNLGADIRWRLEFR